MTPLCIALQGSNFLDLQADPREQVNLPRKLLRLLVFYLQTFPIRGHGEAQDFPYSLEQQSPAFRSNAADALLQATGEESRFDRP